MMPFNSSAAAAAAAAAAAVAAQINASIAAQQRLLAPKPEIKTYFEEDVDINHCKNKHILTKGSTHNQIQSVTGAVVIARGRYKPIGDCSSEDPLHLHVSADSEEKVKAAVERIKHIMGPNPLKAHPASAVCTVGIEPTAGFDSVAEIQGPEGEFLNHIKLETSISEIFLRGRGALPPHNEASEPLHVYIGATNGTAVQSARSLVENLLETVRLKYRQFCSQRQASIPQAYHGNHVHGYSGYPMQPAAYNGGLYPSGPPAYPSHAPTSFSTTDPAAGAAYGAAAAYHSMPFNSNPAGWREGGSQSWAGDAWGSGQGDVRGATTRIGAGKASYNAVGPPPSITYEHQMVMAEEGCFATPADRPSPPDAMSALDKDRSERWHRDEQEMRGQERDEDRRVSGAAKEVGRRPSSPPRKRRFVEFVEEEPEPRTPAPDAAAHAPTPPSAPQPSHPPGAARPPHKADEPPPPKPLLRKLPPVPTFPSDSLPRASPGAGGGAVANVNGSAADKGKQSEAISLLLDEYEEADD